MLSQPDLTGGRSGDPALANDTIAERSRYRASNYLGRLEAVVGGLLTLAAGYLHVLQSRAAGGLWRDEANSAQVANLPKFGQLWRYLEFDSYPPLFHLVVRIWSKVFSADDFSLRILGLLIGLSVLGGFWLAGRVLGVRTPLFALVLLGLNPMMIRYGDSVRASGLGCTLAVLTLGTVWLVAADKRFGWGRVTLASFTAILSVQCLYHDAALLLACCACGAAVALWRRGTVAAAVVLAVGVPAAVSLLPYLLIIARAGRWNGLIKFPVTVPWLWEKLSAVMSAPDPVGVWVWCGLVFLGLGLTGWNLCRPKSSTAAPPMDTVRQVFAASSLVAACLTYAGFLVAVGYVTQPWYYLALLSVVCLCLDVIFNQSATGSGWRIFRLVVVIAFASDIFGQDCVFLRVRSTNIDLVGARLNEAVAPGDLVLVNRWECAVSLNRYYHGTAPLLTLPPVQDHLAHRYDLVLQCMETADPLRPVRAAIEATLRSGGRVWFIGYLRAPLPGGSNPPLPPFVVKPGQAWPFDRYLVSWQQQAAEFLGAHAERDVDVEIPVNAPINGFENQPLRCFEGWQDPPNQTMAQAR